MNPQKTKGFECNHCHHWVACDKFIGTRFRNHCPFCLWSKHEFSCHGLMEPIGLTFKKEGFDKYGQPRQGELMIIHQCQNCGQISINRIAADDRPETILKIFQNSQRLGKEISAKLEQMGIRLLSKKDEQEIFKQLFGKSEAL